LIPRPLFASAWLFGSFARGEETPLSDVDILVEYAEGGISLLKHCAMINDLEALLDRPVHLIEDGTLMPFAVESPHTRLLQGAP